MRIKKRIRCGRVILTKDGEVKKLSLKKGGGSRFCEWPYKYMNFDYVRERLIKIFNLSDTEYQFSLYDFQLRPLDVDQYRSVWDYMKDNGHTCNSTVLYLCTREVDDNEKSRKIIKKKKNDSTKTSSSSTALIEYKPVVKSEPISESPQTYPSLLEYSFKNTTNNLIKYVRNLINENSFDEILIQIFEYCCVIHGYVCSIIDPAQYFQSIIQSEHLQSLDNVNHICESIETLINLNKDKFNQIENFSMINDLFIQFDQNLKVLRNQWLDDIENKSKFNGASTLSHPNIQPSIEDQNELNVKIPSEETYELFQPLLNSATDLLEIMDISRLSTFRTMIKYLITDVEFARSNVDLYNYQSLCNCKQAITSIKIRYTRKFNEHSLKSSDYQFSREIKKVHQKTLREICNLITSLRQYQLQINEHEQEKLSTSFSINYQQQSEDNQFIPSNKRKKFHRSNTQMDVATYSSSDRHQRQKKKFRKSR